jgi:two-component system response regulator HydG
LPHILLVEDDADVRLMMEHILIDAGHQVDTAATLAGGLARVYRERYDVVLADAKLPDGNGTDLADQALERGMRALLITAYAFSFPSQSLQRFEVLLKPLRPVEIVAAVDRALAG